MGLTAYELWEKALPRIKSEMTPTGFNTWIKAIEPLDMRGKNVYLLAPMPYIKDSVDARYSVLINSALSDAAGEQKDAHLILQDEIESVFSQEDTEEVHAPEHPSMLDPKNTFDSFVIGKDNRFAYAAALAVAEAPENDDQYNPLFIYGGVGLGKTHLMHAIGHKISRERPNAKVLYISSEQFTNDLISSIQTRSTNDFRDRYRSVDVLMIDDVQFIAGKDSTQEEFFHTFNVLYQSKKKIILSSDKQPKEIPTLEERLRSRFEWGMIADIQPPDLETRVAILKRKAEAVNEKIPDETLFYIAGRIERNIRVLEGSLKKLMMFHRLTGRIYSKELAKEALKDLLPDGEGAVIDINKIKTTVCEHFNLRPDEIMSKRRNQKIVLPRQYAMYLCRELTELSYDKIGSEFGGYDHTTVLHSCEKIAYSAVNDLQVKRNIEDLKYKITR